MVLLYSKMDSFTRYSENNLQLLYHDTEITMTLTLSRH